jgi:hypothetical protein
MTLEEAASLEIQEALFEELQRAGVTREVISPGDITVKDVIARFGLSVPSAERWVHRAATKPGWKCMRAYDPESHREVLALRKDVSVKQIGRASCRERVY